MTGPAGHFAATRRPSLAADSSAWAGRTEAWLERLVTSGEAAQAPISAALQGIVAAWIVRELLPDEAGEGALAGWEAVLKDRLGEEDPQGALLGCDAASVLLATRILRGRGVRTSSLEAFVAALAAALGDEAVTHQSAELFGTLTLLHELGLAEPPPTGHVPVPLLSPATNLFQADEATVAMIANHVAASTDFGRRPPSVDAAFFDSLVTAVPVWALDALRSYKFELGTTLLRTMVYLGLTDEPMLPMGLHLLVMQQRPEGAFAFLAQEAASLARSKPAFMATWDVDVPATLACIWALAEGIVPGFRLFHDTAGDRAIAAR